MRNPLVTLTLESNHTVNIELYPEVALNTGVPRFAKISTPSCLRPSLRAAPQVSAI